MGGKIGIFEKSPYVPSKKYLQPPPRGGGGAGTFLIA